MISSKDLTSLYENENGSLWASYNKKLVLWELDQCFNAKINKEESISFIPSCLANIKDYLLCGDSDGYIHILKSTETLEKARVLQGHTRAIQRILFFESNNRIISSDSNTIIIWNAKNFSKLTTIDTSKSPIGTLKALITDPKTLARYYACFLDRKDMNSSCIFYKMKILQRELCYVQLLKNGVVIATKREVFFYELH